MRTVIVTGGTSGIGLAIAEKFLRENASVIVASRDSDKVVEKAMSELKACGDAMYQYLELCSKKSCAKLLENVINKYKKVDVLVNAAGVRGKADPPFETDYEDLERTMQINFTGTIRMATMTAEYMKRQGEGTIINISSISGSMVTAPDYGYHCSKCALDMATKILAKEVSPYGVRCLTVAPGA